MIIPGVHPFGPVGPVWWGVCNTPLHGYDHSGHRPAPWYGYSGPWSPPGGAYAIRPYTGTHLNEPTGRKAPTNQHQTGPRAHHINIINHKNKMKTKAFTLILALAMLGLMAVINPAAAQDIRLSGSVAYVVKSDGNVYNGSNSQIGQFRGNTLHNRGGASVGEIRGNSIYRGGSSVGEVRSGTVYNRSGQSIGEIKNGTIYNASHSSIGSYSNVDPTRVAALVFFKLLN